MPNNNTEEFFEAVSSANYVALSRFLSNALFEPNVVDATGKWPLENAINQEDTELIELLLPRADLSHIRVAMFTAVARDNVQALKMILQSVHVQKRKKLFLMTDFWYNTDEVQTIGHFDPLRPQFRPHELRRPEGNPLTLAAIRDNSAVVKLLVDSGFTIERPHIFSCSCRECCNSKQLDFVHFSRCRLAAYSAMATTAYLSLAVDPFLESFKLSVELDTLTIVDSDYSVEYQQLAEQCRLFAVSLFNQCQGSDETAIILSNGNLLGDKDSGSEDFPASFKLKAIQLAIEHGQKKFIAHPVTQRYALNEWYRGVEWLSLTSYFGFLFYVIIATILYPTVPFLFFLPIFPHKVVAVLKSPVVKYLYRTISYVTFLFIVFATLVDKNPGAMWEYACGHSNTPKNVYKILMMFWIVGFIASHIREIIFLGNVRVHFSDSSNVVDAISLCCFILCYIVDFSLALMVTSSTVYHTYYCDAIYQCRSQNIDGIIHFHDVSFDVIKYDLSLAADILLAFGNIFTFARLLFVMPSSPVFGPLTIAFQRMMGDTVRVLFLWAIIMLGFVSAISLVYMNYSCTESEFASISTLVKDLFWSSFGIGEINVPEININGFYPHNDNLTEQTMATYSKVRSAFTRLSNQTVGVGYFLYGAYLMITSVVLVNMLIAIMSKTFDTIYNDRDAEWKFMRASLWMKHYEDFNVLPIPFNLAEYAVELVRWLTSQTCRRSGRVNTGDAESHENQSSAKKAKYCNVCALLAERLQQTDSYDVWSNKYVQNPMNHIAREVSSVIQDQRKSADTIQNTLARLETAVYQLARIHQSYTKNNKDLFVNNPKPQLRRVLSQENAKNNFTRY